MDNKIKHLEFIQNVISRMASNSFMMKGWATVLLAGACTLTNENNVFLVFLAIPIPLICFWWLDSYYLSQERLYRGLYDKVRGMNQDEIDFSLTITPSVYDKQKGKSHCFFSKTVMFFYLSLLAFVIIVVMVYYKVSCGDLFCGLF